MAKSQPFFSIVVPTYQRPLQLAACLEALSRLDYARESFEVIVVDDGSKIPPDVTIASFRDRLQLTLLVQSHTGPGRARNNGAIRARGWYLVFTDDDCKPAPQWLQSLALCFAKTPDHMIGGRTINALPHNIYSTACQLLVDYLYANYNAELNQPHFFTSNNLAVPTDRFRAMGGFDPSFSFAGGEDRELCDRWRHHGYGTTYAPEVLVYHSHNLFLRSFWRQQVHYGRGAFRFRRARARRGQGGNRLEAPSFYLNLLGLPFSQEGSARRL